MQSNKFFLFPKKQKKKKQNQKNKKINKQKQKENKTKSQEIIEANIGLFKKNIFKKDSLSIYQVKVLVC